MMLGAQARAKNLVTPSSRGIISELIEVGDYVVVSLPGAVLPGLEIAARKTYGHVSDVRCARRELGRRRP